MSLLPFLIAATLLAVTPGPGIAYVVARTVSGGRTEGLASCLGTGLGGLVHVFASSLGLSLIIAESAMAFNLLKYIGAAYLIYLGMRMLRSNKKQVATNSVPSQGSRRALIEGIDKEIFYDDKEIALVPMGFCFPGTGKSGDLPPRPECAATWRVQLLEQLPNIKLTIVVGQYAQAWHLDQGNKANLTETVVAWKSYWPKAIPLPHPSPTNNIWLKKDPWFEEEVLPSLRRKVKAVLK
jgi:uracil-DNA glycosylase